MSLALLPASEAIALSIDHLKRHGETVDTGHWQGYDTTGHPDMVTKEILNLTFSCQIPLSMTEAAIECLPNLPWAEDEFQERVGRVPRNPHKSLEAWPWWNGQIETPFTHTYSERFWPNDAGEDPVNDLMGLRYRYGDLDDVLDLLRLHPHTRQATFPIFFPEDTGAKHGGRIPCTLHYHFLLRSDRLHLWYPIRSCDAVRHFRDDVYMAMRLGQWVWEELEWDDVLPGVLNFTAYSFHVHAADEHRL